MIKKNLVELAKTFVSSSKNREILQYINFTNDGYIEATNSMWAVRIFDKDEQYKHLYGKAINHKTLTAAITSYPLISVIFEKSKSDRLFMVEDFKETISYDEELGIDICRVELIKGDLTSEVVHFQGKVWAHIVKTLKLLRCNGTNRVDVYLSGKKEYNTRILYIRCDGIEAVYSALLK